jgi:glycosyltransferase involved in cell wall biosynthesis
LVRPPRSATSIAEKAIVWTTDHDLGHGSKPRLIRLVINRALTFTFTQFIFTRPILSNAMAKTLRILMMLHMPWTKNLGAPRVQYEIAEEFRAMGHWVDKFDIHDAFPQNNRVGAFFEKSMFAQKAAAWVKQHGHNYDVIDAHQANLPFSKQQLKFSGLLCARSCGLGHFFHAYEQSERLRQKQRGERSGTVAGNALRRISRQLGPNLIDYERSFQYADLINVLNQDELQFVAHNLGWADKAVLFHHGLQESTFNAFEQQRCPIAQRYQNQQIIFIGHWGERKGSRDFPDIVKNVVAQKPTAKFLFLGTGSAAEKILPQFDRSVHANIHVIPTYEQPHLPQLLADSTLAVFPSYCEGFPWSVLEKLAAGLPVIAYDIPGVRDMLQHFSQPMMTAPGDVATLSTQLIAHLNQPLSSYAQEVEAAIAISARFRGREIARRLIQVYEERLDRLHCRPSASYQSAS